LAVYHSGRAKIVLREKDSRSVSHSEKKGTRWYLEREWVTIRNGWCWGWAVSAGDKKTRREKMVRMKKGGDSGPGGGRVEDPDSVC